MRIGTLRRGRQPPLSGVAGITGIARLDRRTKNLTKRIQRGDVAIIDHVDIDRVSAEALVARGVSAVVNVAPSTSGRYPNLGPEILVAAGVPLLDSTGPGIFDAVRDGDLVRVQGNSVYVGDTRAARGTRQTGESVAAAMAESRAGLAVQLEAFAANTMDYLRRERDLLLDGVGVPETRTRLEGRHVLIVVRGYDYREDLAALRAYIRDYRPVLIGVDGGADALREAGSRPDMIIGDMDAVVFPAAGTSEDVALLLADDRDAALIVAVGTHGTLVEFLDKGRAGMASTFLTRLRVGGKLVDAKGVSRLHRSRISTPALLLLLVATLLALGAAVGVSSAGHAYVELLLDKWDGFLYWLRGLF